MQAHAETVTDEKRIPSLIRDQRLSACLTNDAGATAPRFAKTNQNRADQRHNDFDGGGFSTADLGNGSRKRTSLEGENLTTRANLFGDYLRTTFIKRKSPQKFLAEVRQEELPCMAAGIFLGVILQGGILACMSLLFLIF